MVIKVATTYKPSWVVKGEAKTLQDTGQKKKKKDQTEGLSSAESYGVMIPRGIRDHQGSTLPLHRPG